MNAKSYFCWIIFFLPFWCGAQVRKDTSLVQKRNIPALEVTSERAAPSMSSYKSAATRVNDLVTTRLQVRIDFDSCFLYGKEWVTLQPHFYPVDTLVLDAKGMAIQEVALIEDSLKKPLTYSCNGKKLAIVLNKTYYKKDLYSLFIKYIAKPNDYAKTSEGGSTSVTSDKGLYFINPQQHNTYIPRQVWSLGYPESNSVWFPTIDKPNQKTLQQIGLTVPDSLTTFSNGALIRQKKNEDGTRTDIWEMSYPNAPYLFTLAVGPFVMVQDHWKQIPVRYFVEKEYASEAKAIFGHTPEMMAYFSKILQVPFPWKVYDQIIVRDFVTGAMENTTASMFGEGLYKTRRQLKDDDYHNESIIAHELFHQWFGDLVTCKSWSNITLNESFGDYGEMLWAEYKYGPDLAAQHNDLAMQKYFYFAATHDDHPLVNHHYKDKEDVLDPVAYQKGGRILNMLRNEVGDSAFFASLRVYLEENKYQSAEAAQLRLAFEKVTGRDFGIFWKQWYYGKGFPVLDIRYRYDDQLGEAKVIIKQTQDDPVFKLPFAIDIYENEIKTRHEVTMINRVDSFAYHYDHRPDLINVDGDKVLLAQKKDYKTLSNFVYQYKNAGKYLDRREAIEFCAERQDSSREAAQLLLTALEDDFYGLRKRSIEILNIKNEDVREKALPILQRLLSNDLHSSVRSAALIALTTEDPIQYQKEIFAALKDSSLQVESTALSILNDILPQKAYAQAKLLQAEAEVPLSQTICTIYARQGHASDFNYVKRQMHKNGSFGKFNYLDAWFKMLGTTIVQTQLVKDELNTMRDFVRVIGPRYGYYVISLLSDFIEDKKVAVATEKNKRTKEQLTRQVEYGRALLADIEKILW